MRARFFPGVVLVLLAGCAERERPKLVEGLLRASGALDFGLVPVFGTRELEVTLRNVGRGKVTIEEAWTIGPEGCYLARVQERVPRALGTSEEIALRVRYTPRAAGAHPGTLVVRTDSPGAPLFRLAISGSALDAAALITPERLDFGRIEADSELTLAIRAVNPSPFAVRVELGVVGADADEFHPSTGAFELEPGAERALDVAFRPTRVGAKEASLLVTPCDGCPQRVVAIAAEAVDQAVVAEPAVLDFGQVPIDRDSVKAVMLRNVTTVTARVLAMSLAGSTDASFSAGPASLPLALPPLASAFFDVRYSPGHMGLATGAVHFTVASRRHPTTDVRLRAYGGSSELCVSPVTYDFGERPVGSRSRVAVTVKNCGASSASPMTVSSVALGPRLSVAGDDQFQLEPLALPRTLNAGEELSFYAYFEPVRPGDAGAALTIRTDAYLADEVQLSFSGRAREYPPCDVALTPATVDFGTLSPRRGAVLGIKVTSLGPDLCAVKNVRLADDGGGVFRLPGGALDGAVLRPGSYFSFMVAFAADAQGSYAGAVQLEVANPASPVRRVPLRGRTQSSCLVPSPRYLDWGEARPDCPPGPMQVSFANACAAPLPIEDVFIGPGTTDGEFVIRSVSFPLPRVLGPADAFSVEVDYRAQVIGRNMSPLFVGVPELPAPLLVPLLGDSSSKAQQVDRFVQTDGSKVDVLFIVDNTASMVEEQPRLVAALPAFADAALARGVDLHVAVTTTGIEPCSSACPGGALGGEAGRLFPADSSAPRLLSQKSPDLAGALQRNAEVGRCAFVEQGFEAMRRALSSPLVDSADDPRTALPSDGNLGFLRDEAALVVVLVGDEDDHSPDDVATYVRFLQARKGTNQPGRATIFAIAPTAQGCATAGGDGTRYAEAAQRTGGEVMNVCASDYAPLLRSVAGKAFSPQDRFPLSFLPDPSSIKVTVDGVALSGGWSYDASTNQLAFTSDPAPGAAIAVSYRRACPQ